MATTTVDDTIEVLNDLIEVSKDGEYGFTACADHVKSPELKTMFVQRASECAQSARELQVLVTDLGGKPDSGGSASGAMHRGWVAVRSALSSYTDLAMLEECERGEDKAVARYRKALEQPLPPTVLAIVQPQAAGAQRNHDQIRDARNRLRAVAAS